MPVFDIQDVKELGKEMDDVKNWNKTLYKEKKDGTRLQLINFQDGSGTWRVTYNDGTVVDGSKGYGELERTGVKSISVINNGQPVEGASVDVVDDKFIIRNIGMVRHVFKGGTKMTEQEIREIWAAIQSGEEHLHDPNKVNQVKELVRSVQVKFTNPKRAMLLATKGTHMYVWDDGDIDILHEWGDHTPYTAEKVGVPVKDDPEATEL